MPSSAPHAGASPAGEGGAGGLLPRVSVVVPTYQRWPLVAEAVASVLAQTEPRLEVIVVDDGSTDGSHARLGERFVHDRRVRILRKENGGTASARNAGLEEVRAPWTAFLDSDDLWAPGHVASQLAFADAHPGADLVVCDALLVGPWEDEGGTVFGRRSWRAPDSMDAMLDGAWALPSCMLLRSSVARALRFATGSHCEDTEMLFRFHAAGHVLVTNPAVLTRWRKHGGDAQAPQKSDRKDLLLEESLELMEAYAGRGSRPKRVRYQLARRRSLLLARSGRWREARPHLWRWWKAKPDSTRALRYLLWSLLPHARTEAASPPDGPSPRPGS